MNGWRLGGCELLSASDSQTTTWNRGGVFEKVIGKELDVENVEVALLSWTLLPFWATTASNVKLDQMHVSQLHLQLAPAAAVSSNHTSVVLKDLQLLRHEGLMNQLLAA